METEMERLCRDLRGTMGEAASLADPNSDVRMEMAYMVYRVIIGTNIEEFCTYRVKRSEAISAADTLKERNPEYRYIIRNAAGSLSYSTK